MGVCIDFLSVNKHAEKNLENIRSFDLTLGQQHIFSSLTKLFLEGLKNMFKYVHSYSLRGSSNNVFVSRPCIEAAKRV